MKVDPKAADPKVEALTQVAASLDGVAVSLHRRVRWLTGVVVLLVAVMGMLVAVSVQNRMIIRTIEDCTDPRGKCASRGQESTGRAVGSLILSNVKVSECVVASGGDLETWQACVRAKGLPVG